MTNSRFYSSIAAATNLQVTASPTDTSIQVASSVGWPNSFPFIVALDYGSANEELVLVTSGGPSIFTVTRAYDGTSATTHNAGAVVRHTSSAIDFTDSRTHEGSSTGVHGITGNFVDTLSTQTVSNKTLNAATINNPTISNGTFTTPTVNGAALSGTITGSPTFSGNPTFSGVPVHSNSELFQRASATDATVRTTVTGDTSDRFILNANGGLNWGPGNAAADVTLTRPSVGTLNVGGDLTWTGVPWTTYTPAWTASVTNPFVGVGGTVQGRYKQYGKTVVVVINIITGTSAFSRGTGTYSVSLPVQAANQGMTYIGDFHVLGISAKGRWMGHVVVSPNATTVTPFVAEVSGGNATGKAVAWQHDTPFAVDANGDQFRFTFAYETV